MASIIFYIGSIPAWAGEPIRLGIDHFLHRVYPRVGGGTAMDSREVFYTGGLSPRGRGNQCV